jgi:hypothetical protein
VTNSPKEQVAEVTKTLADTGLYFSFQLHESNQPVWVLAPFSSGHGDLVVQIRISLTGSILYVYHWIRLSKQPPRELLAHLRKSRYPRGGTRPKLGFGFCAVIDSAPRQDIAG